jgi:glyoxylase I family protein
MITKQEGIMEPLINITGIHHVTLTVSNLGQSQQFYTDILGFKFLMRMGKRVLLATPGTLLVLTEAAEPNRAVTNENRIGIARVSFSVRDHATLRQAVSLFNAHGIEHGEIVDMSPCGLPIYAVMAHDPDNIQVELTAPLSTIEAGYESGVMESNVN